MADSDFAKRQLRKYGWTEGAGLGKQENGRSDPIKVSLKMDKTGVGHDPGKEFTDHWWLRVFNEAAQKIGQNKTDISSENTKKSEDKKNLYKGFVKSSTLSNGIEKANKGSDSSDDESSDEPKTSLPTLDDIHKFCGGATGHRAAMFGIKMKGKLSRVAEQDQQFEKELKKKEINGTDKCTQDKETLDVLQNRPKDETDKKRKKKKRVDGTDIGESHTESSDNKEIEVNHGSSEKKHKKGKRKKDKHESTDSGTKKGKEETVNGDDLVDEAKLKKKKRKVVEDSVTEGIEENSKLLKKKKKQSKAEKSDNKETEIDSVHIGGVTEDTTDQEICSERKKKKRSKAEKSDVKKTEIDSVPICGNTTDQEISTQRKKKKRSEKLTVEEADSAHSGSVSEVSDGTSKKKKRNRSE